MAGPEGWSGRSRGGGFGYGFFVFLIRRAGLRFAYGFLFLVVPYFVPFAPRATAAVWDYNRRALGLGWWRSLWGIFAHYYRFGQTLIDKIALSGGMQERFRFEFDNYERFLELLDSGRGVVMVGAHVGCWEAGTQFFGDYAGRLNIVRWDGEDEAVRRALERVSQAAGFKVVAVNGDGLESVLRIKRALDMGEYVCFQGDRFVGGGTMRGEFMGREARFPQGPFLLGAKLRVPVVFYFATREGGRRYRFHFIEAAGDADRLFDRYRAVLEIVVRRYPRQWFNFYKFWSV